MSQHGRLFPSRGTSADNTRSHRISSSLQSWPCGPSRLCRAGKGGQLPLSSEVPALIVIPSTHGLLHTWW